MFKSNNTLMTGNRSLLTFTRAEAHLQRLAVEQPAEILLVLAQVGALGVGGFQLDVGLIKQPVMILPYCC